MSGSSGLLFHSKSSSMTRNAESQMRLIVLKLALLSSAARVFLDCGRNLVHLFKSMSSLDLKYAV